jgi:hypothetical protein
MSKCASVDAVKNLQQMRPATELHLVVETDHWLAVADEIRHGRCNVQKLSLSMLQASSYKIRSYGSCQSSCERDSAGLQSRTPSSTNGEWLYG